MNTILLGRHVGLLLMISLWLLRIKDLSSRNAARAWLASLSSNLYSLPWCNGGLVLRTLMQYIQVGNHSPRWSLKKKSLVRERTGEKEKILGKKINVLSDDQDLATANYQVSFIKSIAFVNKWMHLLHVHCSACFPAGSSKITCRMHTTHIQLRIVQVRSK